MNQAESCKGRVTPQPSRQPFHTLAAPLKTLAYLIERPALRLLLLIPTLLMVLTACQCGRNALTPEPPGQLEDQFDSSAENEPTVQVFAFTQGDGSANASGLAVDADGNVVVSGDFSGQLDLSRDGQPDVYSRGGSDLLLAKFDPAGGLLWVKTAGGPGEERGYRIALGLDGSIYWSGSFEHEVDFDGDGIVDVRSRGESDVFVVRHDREGNLMWARSAGGPAVDYSQDIELDPLGSAYIAGDFTDHADFNDDGVADVTGIDGREIFIAKWTDDGEWVWTASGVGPGNDRGVGVAVDDDGSAYLTGWIQGKATFGRNVVVEVGTHGFDSGVDASLDSDGNVYVAGMARGETYRDYGMFLAAYETSGELRWTQTLAAESMTEVDESGDGDASVAKFDKNGEQQWVGLAGGSGTDAFRQGLALPQGILVGGLVTAGFSWGTGAESDAASSSIVVAALDANGVPQWSSLVGSVGEGSIRCIAVEDDGAIFAAGYHTGTLGPARSWVVPEARVSCLSYASALAGDEPTRSGRGAQDPEILQNETHGPASHIGDEYSSTPVIWATSDKSGSRQANSLLDPNNTLCSQFCTGDRRRPVSHRESLANENKASSPYA